ncbi:MAG TPA: hydroxypyruvate isomerase [Micromonosporaceae bacterium]|nr:hydroxypyruvate isomerase [Micromonosporaceae bacterium]
MIRFDVNCSILFTELPLLERPAAARSAGFDAVEFWWPFAEAVPPDSEVDAFVAALDDAGVQLVGLNFAAGDMPGGDRGLLSLPDRSDEFRDNIDVTVGIAQRTGCRALNALYGNGPESDLALENLALAADAAARIDAVVLVEALNSFESPRYPLTSTADAMRVIEAVGRPNVRYLADLYHLARMGEDLPWLIARHTKDFGHVQIADLPGRNQPGMGTLDFPSVFRLLDEYGYDGWIGLEYKPMGASVDSFHWIKEENQ